MFEVRVSFLMEDDFQVHDNFLYSIAGPSNHSGAGMGFRDHGFERFEFRDALELKQEIEGSLKLDRAFPDWNVYMREK